MSFFTNDSPSARKSLALLPQCGACGLHKKCQSPKMPVDGQGLRKILVVGDSPGKTEDQRGKPLCGFFGDVVWRTLSRFGVQRDDCWATDSARCVANPYPKDTVDHCRPFLIQAVKELKPKVIILLGNKAVQSLIGWLWKEDVGNPSRWDGQKIPAQSINAWICPTSHPQSFAFDSDKGNDIKRLFFERHLEAAAGLTTRPWQTVPDYRNRVEVIHDVTRAASILDEFAETGGRIAWDIETTSLKPDRSESEIFCCSVCWEGKRTISYPWCGPTIDATARLLRSPIKKIGYNMQFEQRWTKAKLGFWVKNWVWDGMLAAHVLDNRSGVTGLKFQAFVLLGQNAYDEKVSPYLKGKTEGGNELNRIREAPLDEVLLYCGMDSLLEWEVAMIQSKAMGVDL